METELPKTDCHYKLHSKLLQDLKSERITTEQDFADHFQALSLAWDWIHIGHH